MAEAPFDTERLARWLDAEGLPGAGLPLEVAFVSGGASNEIYALTRGEHRMALRKPPTKIPKGRNQTMLREHRVLRALADSDVPHARALAVCSDPDESPASTTSTASAWWARIRLRRGKWPRRGR